jgi:hypothetical protein
VTARHTLEAILAVGCCGVLGGCISAHDRVSRQELPPSWQAALPSGNATSDVSGSYQDAGDYTHEYSRSPDHIARGGLADLLFPELKPPVAAQQVRLVQQGMDRLEIATLVDGKVAASKTVAIEVDRATVGVRLPRKNTFGAGGNLAAATDESITVVLYKGTDGDLYLQSKSFTGGLVALVVPMKVSTENWGHWAAAR